MPRMGHWQVLTTFFFFFFFLRFPWSTVVVVEEPRRTLESNLITTYVAADKSGSIHVVFWGEAGASLKTGDIIRIQGG